MIRQTLISVLLFLVIFMHTACVKTSGNSVRVVAQDFEFVPHAWTIGVNQKISLSFVNEGVQEHEWVVLKDGTEVTLPFNEDDEEKVFWEIETGPGETQVETFTAPSKPGTYTIVCGKPRHIERGMKALLIVK